PHPGWTHASTLETPPPAPAPARSCTAARGRRTSLRATASRRRRGSRARSIAAERLEVDGQAHREVAGAVRMQLVAGPASRALRDILAAHRAACRVEH